MGEAGTAEIPEGANCAIEDGVGVALGPDVQKYRNQDAQGAKNAFFLDFPQRGPSC